MFRLIQLLLRKLTYIQYSYPINKLDQSRGSNPGRENARRSPYQLCYFFQGNLSDYLVFYVDNL